MKQIGKYIAITFLILAGGLLFMFSNTFWGFRLFIVTSSSMEPTLKTGSLIITQYAHPDTYKIGDIITFMPPTKEREFVTHRIIKINRRQTLLLFNSKGDNNKQEDIWTFPAGAIVGKVIVTVPYVGYIFSFIKSKLGILLFILLPALLLILHELLMIIETIKNHKNQTKPDHKIPLAIFFVFFAGIFLNLQCTQSLLSDSATLPHNSFTVTQTQCNPIGK